MLNKEMFAGLVEAGLVYRHDQERWVGLQQFSGSLFPSPRREITADGASYVEELIQPALAPMQLRPEEARQLADLAGIWERLIAVQHEAVARGLAGEEPWRSLAEAVVPQAMRPIALRECGYERPKGPFIRLDMVRTSDGFKVVDINSTRPAGAGDQIVLCQAYEAVGYRCLAMKQAFCQTVRECYAVWRKEDGLEQPTEPARIALVSEPSAGDWHNFRILAETLRSEPWVGLVEVCGQVPDANNDRFNCVLRSRIKFGYPQFGRLLALPADRFCVISPLDRRWIGNKHWFVFLREEPMLSLLRERLGSEDTDRLLAAIPETGVFTEPGFIRFPGQTVDIQSINRNDWIVKPGAGSSGKGIVIGRGTPKWKWEDICSQPAICGALLQRYYRIKEPLTVLGSDGQPMTVQYYIKYGVFMFGGRLAGVEVMARPSALVHGARDTYLSTAVDGSCS